MRRRGDGFGSLPVVLPGVLLCVLAIEVVGAQQAPRNVACRVLEAKESAQFGVRLAIFHYQNPSDRARLGALLRANDGKSVEFQERAGNWLPATVVRLKMCFGRGLLVYRLSAPPLAKGDQFLLRFPKGLEEAR